MEAFTREAQSPGVLMRDFAIFAFKLVIDWAKDMALVQVALLAFCVDLVLMIGAGRRRSFFYRVLEIGERFDLWLNLYNPSKTARDDPDGLFGASRAGDATFLGEMEELVRRGPEPAARPAGPARTSAGLPPRR
jgi:hypothetical protein